MRMRFSLVVVILAVCQPLFGDYHSQIGQDKYLNETFFHDKRDGVFVEFGAYDGITLSNSYFFEQERGWKGICIEPMPVYFEQLKKNRTCVCVQGCIAPQAGTVEFLNVGGPSPMLSGVLSLYDPRHLERISNEVGWSEEKQMPANSEVIKVPSYRLTDLLEQYQMPHVDYLSIDTEGGELEILQSIDFKKYQIDFITVEDNYNDPRLREFLDSQGFELVKAEFDLVFKNRNLASG